MTIDKMHELFRELGQQMGMQQVRSILPDQIDRVTNTSICDIVSQLIRENVGLKRDRANSDNEKISQIQALSTLYKVKEISLCGASQEMMFHIVGNTGCFSNKYNGSWETKRDGETTNATPFSDLFYIVDFAINYTKATNGYANTELEDDTSLGSVKITQWFPVRIIEESTLANVLNDAILKNKFVSPIAVIYDNNVITIYVDDARLFGSTSYAFIDDNIGNALKISYIAKPATVKLDTANPLNNVSCDLPETMHVDVVKHAVDLYMTAINRGTYSQQQNQSNNNQ